MRNTQTFLRFVIPSILSFALSGVYSIVDGFFVGNAIGDAGLSAVNIAYPLVALLQAVGTGIGVGGHRADLHGGNRSGADAEIAPVETAYTDEDTGSLGPFGNHSGRSCFDIVKYAQLMLFILSNFVNRHIY